jgi:tRNA A37 threonylcarbamoyladenosine dehydratase
MAVMKETREDRLAAKLRENLRRRKAQARALQQEDRALSKPERER